MLRTIAGARLRVQAKLTVNRAGDQYEQEADRVAEHVMRMPEPSPEVLSQAIPVRAKNTTMFLWRKLR